MLSPTSFLPQVPKRNDVECPCTARGAAGLPLRCCIYLVKKTCKLHGKLLDSGRHLRSNQSNYFIFMKKLLLAALVFVSVCASPAMADDSVAVKAVKARANVLASALEMLALDGADAYPELLANGINELVNQMDQVEDIIDDLDETEVAEAEAELVKSANFEKLKADYRATMAAYAAKQYLGSENLQDAMEDLEEEIADME